MQTENCSNGHYLLHHLPPLDPSLTAGFSRLYGRSVSYVRENRALKASLSPIWVTRLKLLYLLHLQSWRIKGGLSFQTYSELNQSPTTARTHSQAGT